MNDQHPILETSRFHVGPGTELSNTFRIDSRIGIGRMAEVFRGHNIQTGDAVAIKVVLPEYSGNEAVLNLFRKEARLLQRLAHDAIVRYYLFAVDDAVGRAFLAMEYVAGPSLGERIKAGPLSLEDCDVLRQRLADGLQAAHDAGIVHRDISPDNIILPDGLVSRARIIDFGIALSGYSGAKTLTDGIFGAKYDYASPEQLGLYAGEQTPKSDIYSLGLVLAAAVNGGPLDMGRSKAEILARRQTLPDLGGFDRRVRALLERMLEPDPARRIPTMADVRDQSFRPPEALAPAEPTIIRPTRPRTVIPQVAPIKKSQSPVLWFAALAIAVIGAGAFAGWFYVQSVGGDRATPAPAAVSAIEPEAQPPQDAPKAEIEKPSVSPIETTVPAPREEEIAVLAPPPPPAEVPAAASDGSFTDCADVCPVMVPVPAGRFSMGSGEAREGPVHDVAVRAFALSRREITVAQWQGCVAAGKCRDPGASGTGGGPDAPVRNVTWDDAVAYAAWLSGLTGQAYRLPSEAEWEYAARAGTAFAYSGSNEASVEFVDCKDCGGEHKTAAPRGDLAPNGFGLSGMSGGVSEWVMDCWQPSYAGAPADGSARSGECTQRVLRGGSWRDKQRQVRVSARAFYDHDVPYSNNGLRIARELGQ